jgi:hypothetical protein
MLQASTVLLGFCPNKGHADNADSKKAMMVLQGIIESSLQDRQAHNYLEEEKHKVEATPHNRKNGTKQNKNQNKTKTITTKHNRTQRNTTQRRATQQNREIARVGERRTLIGGKI